MRVKQSERGGSYRRRVGSQLPNQKQPSCHETQNTCFSGQLDFIFASSTVDLISCCPASLNQHRCRRFAFTQCPTDATKLVPPRGDSPSSDLQRDTNEDGRGALKAAAGASADRTRGK